MSFSTPTAQQTGVPRQELGVPTFSKYSFMAETVSVEDLSTREGFKDSKGATATHSNEDPALGISGTMLMSAAAAVPKKGDVMLAKNSGGYWNGKHLEVAEVETTGLVEGRPAAVQITLELWPAKLTYWAGNAPTDLDGA